MQLAKGILDEARAELPRAVALRRQIHESPELGLDLPQTHGRRARVARGPAARARAQPARRPAWSRGCAAAGPGRRCCCAPTWTRCRCPRTPASPSRRGARAHARLRPRRAHGDAGRRSARCSRAAATSWRATCCSSSSPARRASPARASCSARALRRRAQVKRAFALHIDPRIPVGRLVSRPGALLASADSFSIALTGRGGHASMPHDALDPIPVACEIVTALSSFVTRRIDAFDPVVISVTQDRRGHDGQRDPRERRAARHDPRHLAARA